MSTPPRPARSGAPSSPSTAGSGIFATITNFLGSPSGKDDFEDGVYLDDEDKFGQNKLVAGPSILKGKEPETGSKRVELRIGGMTVGLSFLSTTAYGYIILTAL